MESGFCIQSEVTKFLTLCQIQNKMLASLFFGIIAMSFYDVKFERTVSLSWQKGISYQFGLFLSPLKIFYEQTIQKSLLLKRLYRPTFTVLTRPGVGE